MRRQKEQEKLWKGEFGKEYTERCKPDPEQRAVFFEKVIRLMDSIHSVCELGANRGANLRAIASINNELELTGVEINSAAAEELKKIPGVTVVHKAIQDFVPSQTFDFVFISGVLIHTDPSDLGSIYEKLEALSSRYILINEYFNPTPVEIPYHGYRNQLFKRDFAGEFLDKFNQKLSVVDYGFLWKRLNPAWDNTTWVLFRKK